MHFTRSSRTYTFSLKALGYSCFTDILCLGLLAGRTLIWLESFRWNQDMSTPTGKAVRTIKMTWSTSFLHFTDNLKAPSQLAERHIRNILKNCCNKMSPSWKVWQTRSQSQTFWQFASQNEFFTCKSRGRLFYFWFPSVISKETVIIHRVASYI